MKKNKGIALILVLGMLSVSMVMVLSMITSSSTTALSSKVAASRIKLKYFAESALSRAFWLYLADRKKYPSFHRNIFSNSAEERDDSEVWIADGNFHLINDEAIKTAVSIKDADAGTDLSSARPGATARSKQKINDIENEELREKKLIFTYAIDDYIDPNDALSHPDFGMEKDEYLAEGIEGMPKNFALQYIEEVAWIPNVQEFVTSVLQSDVDQQTQVANFKLDNFKIIPAQGFVFPSRNSKPSFFASSLQSIQAIANLNQSELKGVELALKNMGKDKQSLEDTLDATILAKLKQYFSFSETGISTIEAIASTLNGQIVKRIRCVIDCRSLPSSKKYYSYWNYKEF